MLAAFTLLHASVVGYFVVRRGSRNWWAHLVVPVVGAVVMIAVLALSSTTALLVGLVWLVSGIIVHFVQPSRAA